MSTTLSPTNAAFIKLLAKMSKDEATKVIDNTIAILTSSQEEIDLTAEESQAQIGLATLLLLNIRQGSSMETIKGTLTDFGLSEEIMAYLDGKLSSACDLIRANLSNINISNPKVVDCDWKLDYVVSNSQAGPIRQPLFFVTFKLDNGKNIEFTCNEEEMTSLVASLKAVQAEAAL